MEKNCRKKNFKKFRKNEFIRRFKKVTFKF